MGKQNVHEAFAEFFQKILETDIIAGKFAEVGGLEEHLKSTRKVAQEFERVIPEYSKGCFNLLMFYMYKPFMKQPGIARLCKDEAVYYLKRAKSYGIKLPEKKQLPGD